MALLFRKRIKLLPGVHLNLGKKGVSVSAGVRGAKVTLSPTHVTRSIGLPGTGISSRTTQRLAAPKSTPKVAAERHLPVAQAPAGRAGYRVGQWFGRHRLTSCLLIALVGAGVLLLLK